MNKYKKSYCIVHKFHSLHFVNLPNIGLLKHWLLRIEIYNGLKGALRMKQIRGLKITASGEAISY